MLKQILVTLGLLDREPRVHDYTQTSADKRIEYFDPTFLSNPPGIPFQISGTGKDIRPKDRLLLALPTEPRYQGQRYELNVLSVTYLTDDATRWFASVEYRHNSFQA